LDIHTLQKFYLARTGALFSFRFKDHSDFSTSTGGDGVPAFDDVLIGTGDASEVDFQLVKKYVSGATTRTRNITKPVLGTVFIGIDGVNQSSGWTVDTSTGIVTFSSPPGNGLDVTAGFTFDCHARFTEQTDEQLALHYLDPAMLESLNIGIIEVVDDLELADEFFYGGAVYAAITNDYTISLGLGRVFNIVPNAGGHDVMLPDFTNLPTGGPYCYIKCTTNTFAIKDHASNTLVATTTLNKIYNCLLGLDSGGSKEWFVYVD
jgi:uncharacterized protein (TIGR02217 family)